METTVGGAALQPYTTLYSGDSLEVKGGFAVVAVGKTSRLIFGRATVASFLRETNQVTVLLRQGNVSLSHPDDSVALQVKAGDISVTAEAGFKTLGEIAMLNGYLVVVSRDGTLLVDDGDQTQRVVKGKTLTIAPRPARTPQSTGTTPVKAGSKIGWGAGVRVASLAAGAATVVTTSVALARAGNAATLANTAAAEASSAMSAAQAAASAANAAASYATNACTTLTNILYPVISPSLPLPIHPCGVSVIPVAAVR
jgi:hypothetical protein